jgi:hypothetical protein
MPAPRRCLAALSLGTVLVLGAACGEGTNAAGRSAPASDAPSTTLVAATDTGVPPASDVPTTATDPSSIPVPAIGVPATAATLPPAYPSQPTPSSLYPLPTLPTS